MGTHEVAADLKAMGFDMVNRANNHPFDSESEGMFATNALLDAVGIVHAEHVQRVTAPYKHPRVIDFVASCFDGRRT